MSKDNKKNFASKLVAFFIESIVLVLIFTLGYFFGQKALLGDSAHAFKSLNEALVYNKENSYEGVDFRIFWQAWDLLKKEHVDRNDIDSQELVYGAIKGMFAATGDMHTNFFDPKEKKMFDEEIDGSFEGIGAEIGIRDGFLTIVAPLDDSPAQKAGLKPKDKILAIDDEQITKPELDKLITKIRGKSGTKVRFKVLREGEEKPLDITVIRDRIQLKSVKMEQIDDIAYLRISEFTETTASEVSNALKEIKNNNSKGIIVDLRSDPGGLLDSVIDVIGHFVPEESVVVIEKYSDTRKDIKKTHGMGEFKNLPMVILIDEGSASASEIFAGALKDNRKDVVLVGQKSYGKGSVQQLFPLMNGTSAKITIARWLTPKGDLIDKIGIKPDVSVEYTEQDYKNEKDPQKDKAIEIIKEKIKNNNK